MNQSFWKSGSIVKLKEPYKPGQPDRELLKAIVGDEEPQYRAYKAWKGFTHGIIVQVVGHGWPNEVSHVSLHLYDPRRCVMYVESFAHGIPTYVDYHVDELIPLKDGAVTGYNPIEA